MAEPSDVPEGAAVLPEIPPELHIHPLLLAVLHAVIFLAGSQEAVVNESAAAEALEHLAAYLQRLHGPDLERVRADLEVLRVYAQQESWAKHEVEFFSSFLSEFGIGGEG
jgi:hypothetical protein